MKKKLFLFITPDGLTFSCPDIEHPDVENLQVIGWEKGFNEEDALKNFLRNNKWIINTCFEKIICLEIKNEIHEAKAFSLKKLSFYGGTFKHE